MPDEGAVTEVQDTSHLDSHVVVYFVPADPAKDRMERTYEVLISYSNHCYTRLDAKSGKRVFDETRWLLSKKLPAIMTGLMGRTCSFASAGSRNYFTIDFADVGEYEVYFEVFKRRGTDTLELAVHSAYVRNVDHIDSRPKWKTIRFSTILYNVKHNKPMRRPQ